MPDVFDVNIITVPLSGADWAGDDVTGHAFRAPTNAQGGGVTILRADVVNAAATGAGTGWGVQFENWGTGGTAIKDSGGTVAAEVGGTASPFEAGVPKAATIENGFVDAGEWIVIRKAETNSSDPVRGVVTFHILTGK